MDKPTTVFFIGACAGGHTYLWVYGPGQEDIALDSIAEAIESKPWCRLGPEDYHNMLERMELLEDHYKENPEQIIFGIDNNTFFDMDEREPGRE